MSRPTVTRLREIAVPAYGPTVLSSIGSGAVVPVLALTARDLGASVGMAAFVVALVGVGQLVGDLPAGALAARIGERRALLLACAVEAVGMLGCLMSPSVAALGASVLLVGLATAVFALARQAYLTDAVPVSMRARALSTLGGVFRIGLFLGPFVGAAVVGVWGTRAAYAVGALASAGAFAVVLACRDLTAGRRAGPVTGPQPSVVSVLVRHRKVLLTVGVGALFVAVARSARLAIVPLWAQAIGLDAAATSLVFGISGGVDMLLFYPAGWVMDRYGRMLVAVPSLVVMGLGMLALPLASSFTALLVVAVVLGLGNGIGAGIILTLAADAAPVEGRNQFFGGWRVLADSGWAIGPALISAVAVGASLGAASVALGALCLVGAGWMRLWVPRYDPISRRTVARAREGAA